MKIIRAAHMGMCFGVRDAIALATRSANRQKLTILGDLVHNLKVNQFLEEKGIQVEHELEKIETHLVMITAHGASDKAMQKVRDRGHEVIEATCPLVHLAHRALGELVSLGFHPVIIGKRDHVEVRGMTGDLEIFDVVLCAEDVEQLKVHTKFGVVAQTTQPIHRVRYLIALLKERFPRSEICYRDTVCQPTKQRQQAAEELARQVDVVVVIGGKNSNNSRELYHTCSQFCTRVIQIEDVRELKPCLFYNANRVGITAGTSTPDDVIDSVERKIRMFAAPVKEGLIL